MVFLLILTAVLVTAALWWLPKFQIKGLVGVDPKEVFDRENEARKTLAQIVGAVFLLAGLYSSLQTLRVQEQGQVTDRFTKAIDQLGAMQPGPGSGPGGKAKGQFGNTNRRSLCFSTNCNRFAPR